MSCSLRCACGTVQGTVDTNLPHNRCLCYCKSCQAFAHFLNKADILDAQGGTPILQTSPAAVRIVQGEQQVACMSLKPGGLLRWYAKCCDTPIGNTPHNFKMPFVGLIQACLEPPQGASFDDALGPIRVRVNTQGAKGEPKPQASSTAGVLLKIIPRMLKARVGGGYKKTPFFTAQGAPIATPRVLEKGEHKKLLDAL